MVYKLFKAIVDFFVALIALLILSPVFISITIFLYFANQGKPFFYQERPGKNGKVFKIIKYKSMNDKKDESGKLLPDFKRLTTVGKFVRKYSLDEIPQLLNVLKGDMSIVGPRPLLVSYLPLYNENQRKRHNVKPGITGLAQVNGRNALSWDQKFKYDIKYVENISFMLDVKILLKTVKKVFISDGINANDNTTMKEFTGN
ncbi:sugar transferase [uncultured Maribacter sp.]|uniref:sugar transferase n=1 Tax=uncultured Maribacter sp. TaxID=431308 RepID=UPI002611050B|nr:sugar transferase [uncultured Maribacter sp.]